MRKIILILGFIIICAGGISLYVYKDNINPTYKTTEEKDIYVRFVMEGYDKVQEFYWEKADATSTALYFQGSLQTALNASTTPVLKTKNRLGTAEMFKKAFDNATSTEARKNLALNTLIVVTYNLQPAGRNELWSQARETSFREQVANVDPSKDLYKDLGLEKGANMDEIAVAYEKKSETLKNDSSEEAKAELEKVSHAKDVLINPSSKDLYDTANIEPTSTHKIIDNTLYLKMDKISPTTLLEFGRTVYSATTTPNLDSMIIDLRHNLGGALDFAQGFLGLFLGGNQYAFDLYHQNDFDVQRTTQDYFPEIARYKNIILLTDGMTQSTAEVTTAAFKKFKLGTVVGETTRGWGTVENTYPLKTIIDPDNSYVMLLVNSITLRDDNQPIQDRGVDPDISINDSNWKKELDNKFQSKRLTSLIEKILSE